MSKPTRYRVSNFLEVDDLAGGRKVVMVGADGITAWDDVADVEATTPLVPHTIFRPVDLGSFMEYVRKYDLVEVVRAAAERLDMPQREDRLFMMRVLVAYTKARVNGEPSLDEAITAAYAEQARALEMHRYLQQVDEAMERDSRGGNG